MTVATQTRTIHVLNLGAGVQSTCLYLMFLKGEIDATLDYAIFADTGEEPGDVYRHLKWLKSLGGAPILTGSAGKLGDDLMRVENSTHQRFAAIPAFTGPKPGVNTGILRRQCTSEYKIAVVDRVIRRDVLGLRPRQWMPKNVRVVQYFGFSHDEPKRVARTRSRFSLSKWAECRFPLFDLEMTRPDCATYNRAYGIPHEVPRSACVFCPFRSNAEWRHLRDHDSEGWSRAVQVDEALRTPGTIARRGLDQEIYVHRSCTPLKDADLGGRDGSGGVAANECEGMCGL